MTGKEVKWTNMTGKIILDALGNEIVLGALYGTVSKYEGTHTVVVGVAEKITDTGRITLRITSRKRRYGSTMREDNIKALHFIKTVSHEGIYLFPVHANSM